MTKKRIVALALVACLACTCVALVGCSSGWKSTANTGKVAATVNGVDVMEDDVTKYIEDIRTYYGYDSADDWASFLNMYGYTPESLREDILDMYIDKEVTRQAAAAQGISISSETVDSYVNQIKSQYSSEEGWKQALEENNTTEEEYRKDIEYNLMEEQLEAIVVPDSSAPESEVIELANTYKSSYSGMKKSSHILFNSGDETTAQEVLDKINAGTLDFATAAATYSQDSGSASDGGNVGWDMLTSFVDEYQDALDELSVGQVSGLVTSTYGIHIIKCTEEFTAPDEVTSLSQIPTELAEQLQSYADSTYASSKMEEYIASFRASCEVVINDMPSGMSYDVDMSKYETEDETTETTESTTTEATSTEATTEEKSE